MIVKHTVKKETKKKQKTKKQARCCLSKAK
jgi:hypothetical protein